MAAPRANQRQRIVLPAEHVRTLTTMAEDIAAAREELDTLEKIGMDVRDVREKLEWAESARTTLLKQFGPKTA